MSSRLRSLRWLLIPAGLLLALLTFRSLAQEPEASLDIVYGEAGGEKLMLDIYTPVANPAGPTKRPAVVLVHGGGWSAGSRKGFTDMARGAAKLGMVGITVSYRLVKGDTNHWPAQLDDVQRAIRWIRAHAEEYGIDPERIGAIGQSAGGHLVACLGTRDTRDNSDAALAGYSSRVECVVNMCGPSDLTDVQSAQGEQIVRGFLGKEGEALQAAARDASPLFFVDGKSAPMLLIHGQKDDLVPPSHAEKLYAALQKAGVEAEYLNFPEAGHSFTRKEDAEKMITTMIAFLKKQLLPEQ